MEYTEWGSTDGLLGAQVRGFWMDEEDRVWFATRGTGLGCIDGDRIVGVLTRDHGLLDNVLGGLVGDDQGRLWMNSNLGIFGARIDDLVDVLEGRLSQVAIRVASHSESAGAWCARGADGKAYFAEIDRGMVVLDPELVPAVGAPASTEIERLVSDDLTVAVESGRLRLPVGVRRFEIEYTAPDLIGKPDIRFRYRLAGVDRTWNEVGTRRVAVYPNVPPGTHVFEVQAANEEGRWASVGASLTLAVPHRIQETWWLRSLAVLAVVILVIGFFQWRITLQQRHIDEVETEASVRRRAEDRLRELGHQLIHAQEDKRRRIARELHDDISQRLALLSVEMDMITAQPDADLERLPELVKTTQSISADIRRMSHSLHPAKLEQLGIAKALEAWVREAGERTGMSITFDGNGDMSGIDRRQALCLYRIAQEALGNSAKHSGSEWAAVELEVTPDRLSMKVMTAAWDSSPLPRPAASDWQAWSSVPAPRVAT